MTVGFGEDVGEGVAVWVGVWVGAVVGSVGCGVKGVEVGDWMDEDVAVGVAVGEGVTVGRFAEMPTWFINGYWSLLFASITYGVFHIPDESA